MLIRSNTRVVWFRWFAVCLALLAGGLVSASAQTNWPRWRGPQDNNSIENGAYPIKWEQPGFGAGNVLVVNGQIVALSDKGEVVVAKATPEAYTEITRAKIITGKCWTTPALSDGRLYVRSTKEGACVDLR